MELNFAPDLKGLFSKSIDELYDFFKNKDGEAVLRLLGESHAASQIKDRKWKNEKKDKDFIVEIIKSLGMYKEPEIVFNEGVREETHEFVAKDGYYGEGSIFVENRSVDTFDLRVINYYLSSKNINVLEVKNTVESGKQRINIKFSIEIEKNAPSKDYIERVVVVTNYKTYVYKIVLDCKSGIAYSGTYPFKTLKEFYDLYQSSYETAINCFESNRFLSWLSENKYLTEGELYRKFITSSNTSIAMQNFLQMLDFDVAPVLSARFIEDSLVIRNTGKGYLYGKLQVLDGVEADKTDWVVDEKETKIILRGSGRAKVLSNGGCQVVNIEASGVLGLPVEMEYKEVRLNNPLKHEYVQKGLFDIPKITKNNKFVEVYLNDKSDIVIRRKVSYFDTLIKKLKKIETASFVKISYPEKIYHIKIILN